MSAMIPYSEMALLQTWREEKGFEEELFKQGP